MGAYLPVRQRPLTGAALHISPAMMTDMAAAAIGHLDVLNRSQPTPLQMMI
jgi:hypothetical protein